jgi:hypothetical protein
MSQHYPYGLSKKELDLSAIASKELGTKVLLFSDGQWICQAFDFKYKLGFGSSPVHAVHSFKEENDLET